MNLNKLNNIIMFLFFIAVVFSGLTMAYGTRGNGLHYYWRQVHLFSAGVFTILIIFHWAFHFGWFKGLFKKQ
ncbi:MAG: DUF4405 domain-containing protein [Candidatus Paceibacterota bacterium]